MKEKLEALLLFSTLVIVTLFSGCTTGSSYVVNYEDIQADGSGTTLNIKESVGLWGKKISDGNASAGVDADGNWQVNLGAEVQSDQDALVEIFGKLIDKIPATP